MVLLNCVPTGYSVLSNKRQYKPATAWLAVSQV